MLIKVKSIIVMSNRSELIDSACILHEHAFVDASVDSFMPGQRVSSFEMGIDGNECICNKSGNTLEKRFT